MSPSGYSYLDASASPYDNAPAPWAVPGFVNNTTLAEVETNTKALRGTLQPTDTLGLGRYRNHPNTAQNLATIISQSSPVFATLFWGNTDSYAVIKRVLVGFSVGTQVGITGAVWSASLQRAYYYSSVGNESDARINASNGAVITTTLNMRQPSQSAIMYASTGQGSASNSRVNSVQPMAYIVAPVKANTAAQNLVPYVPIWEARAGEPTIVLGVSEGIDIIYNTTAGSSGNCLFYATCAFEWEEVTRSAWDAMS